MITKLSQLNRQSVLAALDEFERLGREQFLARYGFGVAREYFVRHPVTGRLCDSKAIVGVAYGIQFPLEGPLSPAIFSGGAASVVRLLRGLNFEIAEPIGESNGSLATVRRDWSRHEVEALVADYLQMLTLELTGQAYNKSERRRALMPLLDGRTESAIEFKRRNVSAVMGRLGLPQLRGYLPAENVQEELLADVVANQLKLVPLLEQAAEAAVECPAAEVASADFSKVRADAPARRIRASEALPNYQHRVVRRDYLERETRNRSLGLAGEKFIVDFERWSPLKKGLGQLADQVVHKSVTEGDGLGYDVLSFEPDGTERFIEVKTTAFSEETPFFVTANELSFARAEPSRFRLCRVFDFRVAPRFFELEGPVEQHFYLDPATFKASLQ